MTVNKPLKYYFVSIILSFLIIDFYQNQFTEDLDKHIKKFLPADYEMLKRTFPHYNYDKNAIKTAAEEATTLKKLKKSSIIVENQITKNFEFVGPTNIGGRIVDIEFNPKSPNIVYAAAATGGVFKSLDTGINWFPIFDDQPTLTVGDIGIDPNNPEIIYVGTGEANGGHNNFPGLGIYKSTNGGESWIFSGLDSSASIARIIVDPNNSERVFVAAVGSYFEPNPQRGVYLSEDGGSSWEKSLFVSDSTGAIDLVIDPINPNNIYAAMWERVRRPVLTNSTHLEGKSGGIFKTSDGGLNWQKLGVENGLPDDQLNKIGRIGLAISQSNPSIIYASYNDGSKPYGLYKTINGGNNWDLMTDKFEGSSTFSWYFGQIRVHPNIPETIFFLDVAFLKSSNSGIDWDFSYGYNGPDHLHVDHHAIAFHPNNPNYILSGNDGGINISQNNGITWSQPVKLPITQFYEIGLDKSNPNKFFGGTQDNNTITTPTGNEDDWNSIYGGDGFYVIVNPDNPNIIYAESQFGVLGKSTNGGRNFSDARNGIDPDEPTNWSTPVVIDPNNSNVLYYGTHTLYRTENGTENWMPVSNQITDFNDDRRLGTISTIAVAPTNSDVILVGTDDGYVWITNNYASTWKDISSTLPYRWVTRVAIDPKDENIIYATFSGLRWADPEPRVFRSINQGTTWTNISSNLPDAPVNAFAIDNNNTNILYLGNDVGAYVSYNAGSNWEILDPNLPMIIVNDMKIHSTSNYLAIGTHGRGMYKLDLSETTGDVSNRNNIPTNFSLSQNYPNPFNPTTTINYTIPNVASGFSLSVILKVFDNLGQEITTLVDQKQNSGNYKISFDATKLPSGVYYYSLTTTDFSTTKKMMLLK